MAASSVHRRRVGLRQLDRAMAKINEKAGDRAKQLCELIVQEIRLNPDTPYDDRRENDTTGGHLRDSYRVRESPSQPGRYEVVTDRRYWVFVEFGTHNHGDAQPHIRPAVQLVRRMFR